MICETPETESGQSRIAGFTRHYWTFLFAENLYDIGLYIFVITLYNLYLLDLRLPGVIPPRVDIECQGARAVLEESVAARRRDRAEAWSETYCDPRLRGRGIAVHLPHSHAWAPVADRYCFSGGRSFHHLGCLAGADAVAALTNEKNRALGYSIWSGWGIGLGGGCRRGGGQT